MKTRVLTAAPNPVRSLEDVQRGGCSYQMLSWSQLFSPQQAAFFGDEAKKLPQQKTTGLGENDWKILHFLPRRWSPGASRWLPAVAQKKMGQKLRKNVTEPVKVAPNRLSPFAKLYTLDSRCRPFSFSTRLFLVSAVR